MLSAPSHRPPRDTDIVLGRGMAIASRPGNKWLREFAEEHRDEYLQLKRTNKKEMTQYIDSLVDEIYRCDRNFFRIESNNYHIMKSNNYNIVSADEMSQNSHHIIHRKIQQLLNPSNVPKIVNPPDDTNTNNNNSQSRGKKHHIFYAVPPILRRYPPPLQLHNLLISTVMALTKRLGGDIITSCTTILI